MVKYARHNDEAKGASIWHFCTRNILDFEFRIIVLIAWLGFFYARGIGISSDINAII